MQYRLIVLLLLAALGMSSAAASVPFPPHVQAVIVRTLESVNLNLDSKNDVQFGFDFRRYNARGMAESFQCPSAANFELRPFSSSNRGGRITVAECPMDALLNERLVEQQARGFEAAALAEGGAIGSARKALLDTMKPQVIREHGDVFIQFTQWFFNGPIPDTSFNDIAPRLYSGIGGAGGQNSGLVETLLMIPHDSKTVILIQGGLSDISCLPPRRLPLCNDFRSALRETARQVHSALTSPLPPPTPPQELLRPGRPSICDVFVRGAREAMEQSDAKKIPITETLRYQRFGGQSDLQASIREAALAHAQGMDIATAARNVGEQCLSKGFKQ